MSTSTKTFLAVSWVAVGAGVAILGNVVGMTSLILPGFLLIFLGLGVALHVEQVSTAKSKDALDEGRVVNDECFEIKEGRQSNRP